jgi:hypothetical protein
MIFDVHFKHQRRKHVVRVSHDLKERAIANAARIMRQAGLKPDGPPVLVERVRPVRVGVFSVRAESAPRARQSGGKPLGRCLVFTLECGHTQRRRPGQGMAMDADEEDRKKLACVQCTLALRPPPAISQKGE